MQVVCPECKTANPVDNNFCAKCGASLEPVKTAQRVASPPEKASPRKSKRWRWFAIIIGAVVVVLCLCMVVIVVSNWPSEEELATVNTAAAMTREARPTETPKPTKTPWPTQTPRPTNTVRPTDTPQPEPTDTSTSADTPTPTDTPVPTKGIPIEVQLYVLEVAEKGTMLGEAIGALGELMLDPQFGSDAWVLNAGAQVAAVRLSYEALEEMDVPPEMEELHKEILDATGDCYEAMDYLVSGLDNASVEDLEIAAGLIESCGEAQSEVSEKMEEYLEQFIEP
jgi:hypothetical protein